ncbi:MAG: hypothetical protein KGM43_10935, partial [Planctomycetota bacterium]|nr:hypothetical protein [Planctomycetota bacterium]
SGDTTDEFLDDIRLVEGHGFLPYSAGWRSQGGGTRRMVITAADFARKPKLNEFRLEFPEPISIANTAENLDYSPRKVWDLHSLPRRGSKDAAPMGPMPNASSGGTPPPILEGEREAPRPPYFLIGGIVCAIAIGVYAWRRHRGEKS